MRVVLAALAAATVPIGALAAAPQARQEVPVFGTGVQVVAVPVFVTDKDGRAVPGLTRDDFELLDQGRKVPIVAFEAVDAGSLALPVTGAVTAPVVQAAAQRQFLLLFDLMFSTPTGIMRARDAALDFLRTAVAPTDLVAGATFGQAGLRVLVGLTTDREQLARAIQSLGLVETNRLRDPLSLAWDLGIMDSVNPGGPGSGAQEWNPNDDMLLKWRMMLKADRALYKQHVYSFLDSLEQLGRLLAGIHGRKQVILFSAGFDPGLLLGSQGFERQAAVDQVGGLDPIEDPDHEFGDGTARQRLGDFYRALAASDSVIHAFDVAGLAAGPGADEPLGTSGDPGRETLAQFALNTGGRFVKDTSDLGAGLRQVLDATRYSYVLAFEPGEPARKKEKPRTLEVKLKREGLSVSYRRGYVLPESGPTRDASVAQLQAAESIVKGLSGGPIALRVVAVPYRDARGRTLLPVVLEADGTSLTTGAGSQVKLEVYGYALDGEGRIRDVLFLKPTLDLAKLGDRLRARGLQVITTFAVPAGPADLRFLVRDATSGRTGSLRVRLTVPPFEGDTLVVSAPLFMDDPQARVVLPTPSRMNPQIEIPFRVRDAAFTPDGLATIYRGEPREVCLLAWRGTGEAAGPLEVTAELVGATASSPLTFAHPPRLARDADGFQRVAFTVEPGDLPDGPYALRVTLRDPRSGSEAHSELGVELTERRP